MTKLKKSVVPGTANIAACATAMHCNLANDLKTISQLMGAYRNYIEQEAQLSQRGRAIPRVVTGRPARSAAMPVLFLLSGPKIGFSSRRGDTLPR